MRLNKFLSQCGIASRRVADQLIAGGHVTVNGAVVTQLGVSIDEARDQVAVDGRPCKIPEVYTYIMLNKPVGYLVTMSDQFGRKTVRELIRGVSARVNPVGRLDLDSEGLLLLTNDGGLAFRLSHPRHCFPKSYIVYITGYFKPEDLRLFADGIRLEDGHLAHAEAAIVEHRESVTVLSLVLREGRKREIRQMCKTIGYPVISLKRVKFGQLTLGNLGSGRWRHLTAEEVQSLKADTGL